MSMSSEAWNVEPRPHDEHSVCPAGCGTPLLRRVIALPSPSRYEQGVLMRQAVLRQRVEYRLPSQATGAPLTRCPHCEAHLYGPVEGLKHG